MPKKPTYDELVQRVRELESSAADLNDTTTIPLKGEQIFMHCFENANIGVCLVDPDGEFIKVNRRMVEIFGFSKEEFEGMNVSDVSHPEDIAISLEVQRRIKVGEIESTLFEKRYIHKKGHMFWGQVSNSIVKDHLGTPLYFVTHFMDITENKKNEEVLQKVHNELESRIEEKTAELLETNETLQESERRLELASESGGIGLWELNLVDHTTWRSLRHDQIFGYETLLPEWTFDMFLEHVVVKDRPMVEQKFGNAIEKNDTWDFECRIKTKDGSLKWIWARGVLEIDANDQPSKMLGVIQDITDRKRAEKERQEGFDLLNNLARLVPGVIYQYRSYPDGHSAFPYSSPGMSDIYEVTPEEVSEDASAVFGRLHPEDRDRVTEAIFESARTLKKFSCEFRVILPEKGPGWRRSEAYPERTEDGGTLWHGIILDINEQKRAEETILNNYEMLKRTEAMANIGSWEWDVQQDQVRWSDELFRIFGRDPVEGAPAFAEQSVLYANGDMQRLRDAVEICVKRGMAYEIELRAIRTDGEMRHCVSKGQPQHDEDGKVFRLTGSFQDITERKQAEIALKDSESRTQTLINTLPDLIWLKDEDGVYLSCNSPFEQFFGAKESEIVGKTDYDFVDKELADFFREHDQKAIDGKGPRINEEKLTFAATDYNGIFETIKTPMFDTDKNLIGVLGIARDITFRKEAEQILRESERKWKEVVTNSPQIGVSLDTDARIIFVNDHFQKLFGYTSLEVIGKNWFDLFIPEDIREEMRHVFTTVMSEESASGFSNYDNDIVLKNGELRHISWSNVITKDINGKIIDVTCLGIDLTERKRAEDERIRLTNQLLQAQKMESIGTLAGGIAHDFNNILSSILGFTELAMDGAEKDSSIGESLQEVYAAGNRAKSLVKQILAFARQSTEEIKPVHLKAIAEEISHLLRSSIPTTIKITRRFESNAYIMANSTQLHQIIMNLCTNAAHAMEDRGGQLTVSTEDLDSDQLPAGMQGTLHQRRYVQLQVADTGTGISPDIMDSIFEPYFTTKGVGEGTGMGLAMVKGIVESYDGHIEVTSTVGDGTTFTIYLPVTTKEKIQREYEAEILPTGTERVLVVDDEAPIARLAERMLNQLGYDVTVRTSSMDALELFKVRPADFDLVITDMTMPNLTGDKLTIEVMKIRADIPVILCTGYSKQISDESALDLGIKAFVYKPFVRADLAKTVRRVLDENT